MRRKEIGSEFPFSSNECSNSVSQYPYDMRNGCFVFSGRTAIEMVLMNESSIHKALLPSYCCDSMIEPFRRFGIEIDFYSVNYIDQIMIELKVDNDVDCILWCNYFGFTLPMPDMSGFIERGGIIIEDITHSLYSREQFHEQSLYRVASIRKWESILCGGYCISKRKKMLDIPLKKPDDYFLQNKKNAILLKQRYLEGKDDIEKQKYLQMYADANKWLIDNFSCLAIDEYSKKIIYHINYQKHINQRINNAKVLYRGLKKHTNIEFMFDIHDMDCPLFVPVIIKNGKRDYIRKELIDNEIYCPVHWPHPNANCDSNLYKLELSLICDHRYDKEDMQRIIGVLCS